MTGSSNRPKFSMCSDIKMATYHGQWSESLLTIVSASNPISTELVSMPLIQVARSCVTILTVVIRLAVSMVMARCSIVTI